MTNLAWRLVTLACALATPAIATKAVASSESAAPQADPPAPYLDRVLENLPPDSSASAEDAARDLTGWPRRLGVESRWFRDSDMYGTRSHRSQWIEGLLETPNHGTWSVDGAIGNGRGLGGLTLRQRDMPLAGGWWADHEVGLIASPTVPLSRKPSRVYLPGALLRGAKGEWAQRGDGMALLASIGRPAWSDGILGSDLQTGQGQQLGVGVQWGALDARPTDTATWGTALQVTSGRGLASSPGGFDRSGPLAQGLDTDSVFVATRRESQQSRLQLNALQTRSNGEHANARAFWLDSSWGSERQQQSAGAYWLGPGLSWAGLPMPSDLAGLYARSAWQERQWSAEGSIDWLRSIEQPWRQGYYATGAARWRLNRQHQISAGLSLRRYAGQGWSTFFEWRAKNPWGMSGIRWDQSSLGSDSKERQLTFNQDWDVVRGWSLGSSLSLTRTTDRHTQWGAGVNLSVPLSTYASARANLSSGMGNTNGRHLNLALGLNWRVMRDWHLDAQYTRYTGEVPVRSLDPLAPPPPALKLGHWSFFLVLRYEWQAGSATAPLGGQYREGGGRIEGTVYLDANRNGKQDADEPGAAGVQVYLDNRYVVRTNAQGRYEFALVAAGGHTVSVRNDSLPLPWGIVGDGQARVTVGLRDGQNVDFPVQRTE